MRRALAILATIPIIFALTAHAALIEYDYTGRDNYSGGGSQSIVTYAGVMIFDTISSNVTFVDLRSDHTYHWSVDTNLVFTTIGLKDSITRTVITDSEGGIDTNGYYHLNDYMISGQNVTLTISSNATCTFPRTFSGSNNRNISADTYGTYRLKTWGEHMTFSPARTIPDNNQGLSASNVLNIILNELQTKGTLSVH
jgi:hypothetical protein